MVSRKGRELRMDFSLFHSTELSQGDAICALPNPYSSHCYGLLVRPRSV